MLLSLLCMAYTVGFEALAVEASISECMHSSRL